MSKFILQLCALGLVGGVVAVAIILFGFWTRDSSLANARFGGILLRESDTVGVFTVVFGLSPTLRSRFFKNSIAVSLLFAWILYFVSTFVSESLLNNVGLSDGRDLTQLQESLAVFFGWGCFLAFVAICSAILNYRFALVEKSPEQQEYNRVADDAKQNR